MHRMVQRTYSGECHALSESASPRSYTVRCLGCSKSASKISASNDGPVKVPLSDVTSFAFLALSSTIWV